MKQLIMLLLLWSSFAWSFNFGVQGSHGRSGYSGQAGARGKNIVVHADGRPLTLNLDGSDAGDAGHGENGADAYACNQSRGRYNERGANGGDGGSGGNGGNGGDGGDATIFYKKVSDLNQISISNGGGRAGRAGEGSYAGSGCRCYDYSWSHRVCNAQQRCTERRVCDVNNQNCRTERQCRPVTVCRNEYYTCSDGQSGREGRRGANGHNGEFGRIKIVNGRDKIPNENSRASLSIGQLVQADFVLSKQIWKEKNDGHSLFANNSHISGTYQEFIELRTRMVGLKWNSARDLAKFKDYKIELHYNGNDLSLNMPEGLFINYELRQNYQNTVILINEIYTTSEISNLSILKTQGYGSNLVVSVKDNMEISDEVQNEVKLQWVHRKWRIWYEVYDKVVPPEFVASSSDKIEVNVGKLGISNAYIARGKQIRYTLWIKRTFGNNVTEVKLHQSAMTLK